MMNNLKKNVSTTEVKPDYAPNKITSQLTKADQGFKSLIGLNTEAKMLKWKMKDIVGVIKNIFTGAGQIIPTITQQYAKKAKVDASDGLIIEGGGMYLPAPRLLPPTIVWEQRIALVVVPHRRRGALTCMLSWH
jgi:hypothetical protein